MSTILTAITHQYQLATINWHSHLFPIAQSLFASLAVIEIAWSGLQWAICRNALDLVIGGFIHKFMTISFFYALLLNAQTWMPALINGFIRAGAVASGMKHLDPSAILDQGISIAMSIFHTLSVIGMLSLGVGFFIGGFAALSVIICFAVIATQLVISLIESYLVIAGGVLLLGFSGSRWTLPIAAKFLDYAVVTGIKLFVIYLVVGVGSHIAANWGDLVLTAGITNPAPFFEVLGGALVFLGVTWKIPSRVSSMLTGNTAGSLSHLVTSASSIIYSQNANNHSVSHVSQEIKHSMSTVHQAVKAQVGKE